MKPWSVPYYYSCGPAPKWAQQVEEIAKLLKAQQHFGAQMLYTVLTQAASR